MHIKSMKSDKNTIITEDYKLKNNYKPLIGIITSGGDAPGMNSAIKGIIKMAHKLNAEVYGIYNGFKGLIENKIEKFGENKLNFESLEGGTILGTARSEEFKTREGRKTAANNIICRRINCLIVIGGGGSMRGTLRLWSEFTELQKELIIEKKIHKTQKIKLKVVTIPASIDNDIYGTESTVGADSAANRVVETVDKLMCTMRSHRRILVVECMGNGCGWLTVASAVALNGDYVIVPERRNVEWKEELRKSVNVSLQKKKEGLIIFLSEKSKDGDGNIISLKMIQEALKEHEVRMLCIGHTQRGGPTSGIDAVLGTLAGIKSVGWCVTGTYEPKMVCFSKEGVKLVNLKDVVVGISKNEEFIKQEDYESLFERRSGYYKEMYCKFEEHRKEKIEIKEKEFEPKVRQSELKGRINRIEETSNGIKPLKIVVLNGTKIISGMNCFLNSVVQEGIYNGHKVYNCFDCFSGLEEIECSDLSEFSMLRNKDGCGQGDKWNIEKIKNTVKKTGIDYLVVVGGNDNLSVANGIENTIIVPACYENGLRGIARTIGCDTALNTLIGIIKVWKQNVALPGMVAIIEIGEKDCNYLNIMAGIACDVFSVLDGERGCFCVYDNTAEIIQKASLLGKLNKENKGSLLRKLYKETNTKNISGHLKEKTVLETLKRKIIAYREKNKNAKIIILKHSNFYSQNIIKQVFSLDIEPVFISNVFGIAGEAVEPCFKDRVYANISGIALIKAVNQNVGSGIIAYENLTADFKSITEVIKIEREYKKEEWRCMFNLFD